MSYFGPRQVETTLPCPSCKSPLWLKKGCTKMTMHCEKCKKSFPLKDFIANADEAMENFLENAYFDRI